MSTLLVAGPCHLDHTATKDGLIGGGAAYAAIAAAPLTHTQLWSRGGEAYAGRLQEILRKHRIDDAGLDVEGDTSNWSTNDGWQAAGPALPELEPVSAENLSAVLLVHLDGEEEKRAHAVLDELGGNPLRIVAPRNHSEPDLARLCQAAERADVLIVNSHAALHAYGGTDVVSAGQALRDAGAKTVLLTTGASGGVIMYKNKTATWPSFATVEPDEVIGSSAMFAGAVAGQLADHGHLDFRGLKRFCITASAIRPEAAKGPGPVKLLSMDRAAYTQAFTRLRRNTKP